MEILKLSKAASYYSTSLEILLHYFSERVLKKSSCAINYLRWKKNEN
jgi:hypothetical protein